jgi:hypothetical protein
MARKLKIAYIFDMRVVAKVHNKTSKIKKLKHFRRDLTFSRFFDIIKKKIFHAFCCTLTSWIFFQNIRHFEFFLYFNFYEISSALAKRRANACVMFILDIMSSRVNSSNLLSLIRINVLGYHIQISCELIFIALTSL